MDTDWGYKFTVVATAESSGDAAGSITTGDLELAVASVNELALYGTALPDDVEKSFMLPFTVKTKADAVGFVSRVVSCSVPRARVVVT